MKWNDLSIRFLDFGIVAVLFHTENFIVIRSLTWPYPLNNRPLLRCKISLASTHPTSRSISVRLWMSTFNASGWGMPLRLGSWWWTTTSSLGRGGWFSFVDRGQQFGGLWSLEEWDRFQAEFPCWRKIASVEVFLCDSKASQCFILVPLHWIQTIPQVPSDT